jgi:hypothetical protein
MWWGLVFDMIAVWIHPNKIVEEDPEMFTYHLSQLKEKYPDLYSSFDIVKYKEEKSKNHFCKNLDADEDITISENRRGGITQYWLIDSSRACICGRESEYVLIIFFCPWCGIKLPPRKIKENS